jgi:hypothetical protein
MESSSSKRRGKCRDRIKRIGKKDEQDEKPVLFLDPENPAFHPVNPVHLFSNP